MCLHLRRKPPLEPNLYKTVLCFSIFVFVVSKGCFLLEGDLLALLLDGPYGGEKKLEIHV